MPTYKLSSLLVLFILLLTLTTCSDKPDKRIVNAGSPMYDLLEIQAAKELRALVDNSTTSYFIYKGTPMGFEYELLARFAAALKVELKVIPVKNLDYIIDSLLDYKGDIIAANLTITQERNDQVAFSEPLIRSKQVLVQRKKSYIDEADNVFINSPTELIDKEVYVRKNSSFYRRLLHLSHEIGNPIEIREVSGELTVEELIKKVSEGEIDYTVADEHVAKINKAYFKNIDISTPISLEQKVAWAVRKESSDLLIALNAWLRKFKKTTDYRVIYLKYFGNTMLYKTRVNSSFFATKSGVLSPFDELIKEYSSIIGWDWKFLTALIYQESQFDHSAESWTGANGLMQLMPATAAEYGTDSAASPEENIKAGVNYLKWLNVQFTEKVRDSVERVKFILAAYNVGLGHVFDAIRLAEKNDLNTEIWDNNVAEMLLLKANPEYYNDPVVHYGYCRGSEPYKYVKEIFNRFEHYQNITENIDSQLLSKMN